MSHRLVRAALVALLAAAPAAMAAAATCSSSTVLTLVGADTSQPRLLFSASGDDGGARLVDLDLGAGVARWHDDVAGRFSGSVGAGPVLAARRCGARCVQVVRWEDGWRPVGEPLLASDRAVVHLGRDGRGTPWLAFQTTAGEPGLSGVILYRFDGRQWLDAGGMAVRAVGNPAILPAPDADDAVVLGDGRFAPGAPPRSWVAALPEVAEAARGQLRPLPGGAVYLAPDGHLHLLQGAAWRPVRWKPFVDGEGDLSWRPGVEYWMELPEGAAAPPLAVVWTDNRVRQRRRLYLAEWAEGRWRSVLDTPDGVLDEAGERVPYSHIVRFAPDAWALVLGCIATADGPVIALRGVDGGELGLPLLVPVGR